MPLRSITFHSGTPLSLLFRISTTTKIIDGAPPLHYGTTIVSYIPLHFVPGILNRQVNNGGGGGN